MTDAELRDAAQALAAPAGAVSDPGTLARLAALFASVKQKADPVIHETNGIGHREARRVRVKPPLPTT